MEVQIYNPAPGTELEPVQWNFEELKAQITAGLTRYENTVYTPETMAVAKKDRADLNRLSKALNAERISMKRRYLAPYEEFERQAKELTGLIDAQAEKINAQAKEFEQEEKDSKQVEIMVIYGETVGDFADLIPYEKIHDPKWLNKGTSLKAIREAMETIFSRAAANFSTINMMGFDEQTTNRVKAAYLRRFDLADAMAEKQIIERENRRLAEYELAQKAKACAMLNEAAAYEKAKAEKAAESPAEPQKAPAGGMEPAQAENPAQGVSEPHAAAELIQLDFRVWASREDLAKLKQFLISNGIKYGKVE